MYMRKYIIFIYIYIYYLINYRYFNNLNDERYLDGDMYIHISILS